MNRQQEEPDFFLSSREHRGDLSRPRRVWRKGKLRAANGADLLWVEVDPPLLGQEFNSGEDVTDIILAPHYDGDSLFPIESFPTPVYVYRARSPDAFKATVIHAEQLELIAWAEAYKSLKDAQRASEELH